MQKRLITVLLSAQMLRKPIRERDVVMFTETISGALSAITSKLHQLIRNKSQK